MLGVGVLPDVLDCDAEQEIVTVDDGGEPVVVRERVDRTGSGRSRGDACVAGAEIDTIDGIVVGACLLTIMLGGDVMRMCPW